ncbi:hypothetical protein TRFO_29608 [Tritrichomonas foetus]|uniref:Importin N-terminal domain-containing protein n=1 Tax=Tritrichomonas foetus TaxID=1144522 RepID=A0A1J4JZY5_9EUKA|nr:hypothetical protein TRFO_29608 [Tritrichomonas foetus]|eukprot:OHT03054.1 hypothetical protein TRFO_29608 [Tritrichomonas foetus]
MDAENLTLDQIEELVQKSFKGEKTILDVWLEDAKFTSQCKVILDSPDVKFNSAFFAVNVLKNHVARFFNLWDPEFRFTFALWYFNLINTQTNLLISNPPLLRIFSQVAGDVAADGWDSDPRFQTFVSTITRNEIPSDDENVLVMHLCMLNEISNSMRVFKVISFSKAIVAILDFSIRAVLKNHQKVTSYALETILSALNYFAIGFEPKNDDFTKLIFSMDEQTSQFCMNPDFLQLLFSIPQKYEASICYEILTLIISSDLTKIPHDIKKLLLLLYLKGINDNINIEMNSDSLNHFFRLLLRLKIEMDRYLSPSQYNFIEFCDSIFKLSINIIQQSGSLIDNSSAVGNILSFFETNIHYKSNTVNLEVMSKCIYYNIQIILAFLESALKHLEYDEENTIDILEMNTSTHFNSWLVTINKLASFCVPEVLEITLPFLFSDEMNAAKQSYLCSFHFSILMNLSPPTNENYPKYVEIITSVIMRIMNIYHTLISTEYVINSFLLFLRHFEKFPFLCTLSDFSHRIYSLIKEKTGSIGSVGDMMSDLFQLLWQLLQNLDSPTLIYDSSKALSYLFSVKAVFHTFVMDLPIVHNLVQLRVENPFPFLSKPTYYRSRIVFHSSLCTILVNKDAVSLRTAYLSTYNDAVPNTRPDGTTISNSVMINEEALWGFLCDFTGFFQSATKTEEFKLFFDYLHSGNPSKIDNLIDIIPQISKSPILILPFLKFWSTLLHNDPRRIEFRHHSPEGLILFHQAVKTLTTLLGNIQKLMVPKAEITRKTVCYCFQIINSLLNADYIPYLCLDYYEDKSLEQLLIIFRECLNFAPPQTLNMYPKLERLLLKLTSSICTKHIEATCKPNVNITPVILQIITYGLRSSDPSTLEQGITSLTGFMNFSQIMNVPPPELIAAACELWNLLLLRSKYTVQMCIKEIFARIPQMINVVHDKMAAFLIPGEEERFQAAYDEFFNSCSKMFDSGKTEMFPSEITKFISESLKCLRAPTKVFRVPVQPNNPQA